MNNAGFGIWEFYQRDIVKKEMIRLNITACVEITHGILRDS